MLEDERQLRSAFQAAENGYNVQRQVGTAALFLGYFPLTYKLAAKCKPATIALWSVAYYYGLYKNGLQPATTWMLQSTLNRAAQPLAVKYGVYDI